MSTFPSPRPGYPTPPPAAAAPGEHPIGPPRPRGSSTGAKLLSVPIQLVLSLGLLAWMAGYTGQMVHQLQIMQPASVPLMLLCVAGVVLTTVLIGLVNRLSALGAVVAGGCWLLVGLVLSFASLGGAQLVFSASRVLPVTLGRGFVSFLGYGSALLVGGLLLAGGLGAAWARRSRR